MSVCTRGLFVLLLVATGSVAASAPVKASEDKPVDKLVAAAQSVLQQAKQNVSVTQHSGHGRRKGDSFTSPVDGYFIQVRIAEWHLGEASPSPVAQSDCWPHLLCRNVHPEAYLDQVNTKTMGLWCLGIRSSQN